MTQVIKNCAVTGWPQNRHRCSAAFTFVEMLSILAMLMLAGSIVLPNFGRAFQAARSAACRSNLHHLSVLLHTEETSTLGLDGQPITTMPGASRWTDFVVNNGQRRLLLCPSDNEPYDMLAALRHVYIRQDGGARSVQTGVRHTNLADLLAGRDVPDEQVYYEFRGNSNGSCSAIMRDPVPDVPGAWRTVRRNVGWQWVYDLNDGKTPLYDQAMVAIATCAAFSVTLDREWLEIRPLGHHPQWKSASRHWVCKGNPYDIDGWEPDVLVRLTGMDYETVNPPVMIYGGKTSYGMSNLVGLRYNIMDQVWLTEYTHDMVDLTPGAGDEPFDNDPINGEVLARHLGRANIARVDGGVEGFFPSELASQQNTTAQLAAGP